MRYLAWLFGSDNKYFMALHRNVFSGMVYLIINKKGTSLE